MTRRFEFVGGTSAKFWEVTLAGTSVTVRYGRIGTEGQMQGKTFPTGEDAAKHAEKLVSQKTRKGYVECVVR
jgi:predicted DNA-binding WGR domain protein